MSTLAYALLGLIARKPQSGYDLAAQLKAPVARFWSARLSQIYPELARLESEGLVEVEVVPQDGRPARKVYRLTAAGRTSLAAWVATAPEPVLPRDELLLKTYALPFAEPGPAAAMYAERAAVLEAELQHYEQVLVKITSAHGGRAPPRDDPSFGQYANLRYAVAGTRTRAEWCRWLEGELAQPIERPRARSKRRD